MKDAITLCKLAIASVRAHYPESVFPPDGESLDCKSAFMARVTCDNILRELDERLDEEKEKEGGVSPCKHEAIIFVGGPVWLDGRKLDYTTTWRCVQCGLKFSGLVAARGQ